MTTQTLSYRVVPAEQAVVYDQFPGEKNYFLLTAKDTGGTFAMISDQMPPGSATPLHIHHNEDETCYVLEGELTVQVAGERFVLKAGDSAFLPKGVQHALANFSNQNTRTLYVCTPGGAENFFVELEPLATQAEPDMGAIIALAAKYNIEVNGPPMTP